MKYIIIILFLVGCGGSSEIPKEPEIPFTQLHPNIETLNIYYGITEEIENGWKFKSHLIDYPKCERAPKPSYCKKIGIFYKYDASHQSGRETKITYNINVNEYNIIDPPYFNIFHQDWFDYDPDDNGGNHPFTTLKLKVFDNKLYIVAYNNKWQWKYDFYNPYNSDDPEDKEHLHPENEETGRIEITLNTSYQIKIIVKDGIGLDDGETIIKVNGQLLSHELYQTKPLIEFRDSIIYLGLYWDRDYNPNINYCAEMTGLPENECKSNQITIEDFKVFERIVN